MALADFVRDAREARGLSQRELSKLAGVSLASIRNIEQGMSKTLRLETARRLARALHVSVDRLAEAGRDRQAELKPAVA